MKQKNKEKRLKARQDSFKNIGSDPRGLGKTKGLEGFHKPGSINK